MRNKNKGTREDRRATDSPQKRILFDRRILLLTDVIDSDSARDLIESLMALDCLKKAPILLRINCPGGSIEQGMAIIDTMNDLRSDIHTVICGECASMATFIALNGDKRLMTANSYWMAHEMSRCGEDYYSKEKFRFKYEEKIWLQLRDVYLEKLILTKEDVATIDHGELWLNSKQCLERRIIETIIGKEI